LPKISFCVKYMMIIWNFIFGWNMPLELEVKFKCECSCSCFNQWNYLYLTRPYQQHRTKNCQKWKKKTVCQRVHIKITFLHRKACRRVKANSLKLMDHFSSVTTSSTFFKDLQSYLFIFRRCNWANKVRCLPVNACMISADFLFECFTRTANNSEYESSVSRCVKKVKHHF